MSIAGIQITTDLELVEMNTADYSAISQAVGGYIEHIELSGDYAGYSLYVHEEGKLQGLPFNDIASAIWERSFGRNTDYILGNVVVVSSTTDDEGNELPLTDDQVENFLALTQTVMIADAEHDYFS